MKKDKKWLKAEIDNQAIIMDKGYIHRGDLMYLIDKLDEPEVLSQELPVIPKYVAEWIIRHRDILDLYPALRTLEYNTSTWEQVYKWYRENTHEFVNAYLTGEYEVEEETLYYALIKGHEFPSGLLSLHDGHLTKMSKEDWNVFGVNDSNADFVRVDK